MGMGQDSGFTEVPEATSMSDISAEFIPDMFIPGIFIPDMPGMGGISCAEPTAAIKKNRAICFMRKSSGERIGTTATRIRAAAAQTLRTTEDMGLIGGAKDNCE
jgi:hypothetical protein